MCVGEGGGGITPIDCLVTTATTVGQRSVIKAAQNSAVTQKHNQSLQNGVLLLRVRSNLDQRPKLVQSAVKLLNRASAVVSLWE